MARSRRSTPGHSPDPRGFTGTHRRSAQQPLLIHHDGYIYTGFGWARSTRPTRVCLSATDDPTQTMEEKLPTWYHYTSKGGFYCRCSACDASPADRHGMTALPATTGKPSLLSHPKTGELPSSSCQDENVTGDISQPLSPVITTALVSPASSGYVLRGHCGTMKSGA